MTGTTSASVKAASVRSLIANLLMHVSRFPVRRSYTEGH